jgi:hypothetical protein
MFLADEVSEDFKKKEISSGGTYKPGDRRFTALLL